MRVHPLSEALVAGKVWTEGVSIRVETAEVPAESSSIKITLIADVGNTRLCRRFWAKKAANPQSSSYELAIPRGLPWPLTSLVLDDSGTSLECELPRVTTGPDFLVSVMSAIDRPSDVGVHQSGDSVSFSVAGGYMSCTLWLDDEQSWLESGWQLDRWSDEQVEADPEAEEIVVLRADTEARILYDTGDGISVHVLERVCSIGSTSECDIRVNDCSPSRDHLLHVRNDYGRWIATCEIGPPPLINEAKRNLRRLRHGDLIELEATRMIFVAPDMMVTAADLHRAFSQTSALEFSLQDDGEQQLKMESARDEQLEMEPAREPRLKMAFRNVDVRQRWRGGVQVLRNLAQWSTPFDGVRLDEAQPFSVHVANRLRETTALPLGLQGGLRRLVEDAGMRSLHVGRDALVADFETPLELLPKAFQTLRDDMPIVQRHFCE